MYCGTGGNENKATVCKALGGKVNTESTTVVFLI
jgi:hypothetical protein